MAIWQLSMTTSLMFHSIDYFLQVSSCVASGRPTRGLARSAVMRDVRLVGLNVHLQNNLAVLTSRHRQEQVQLTSGVNYTGCR